MTSIFIERDSRHNNCSTSTILFVFRWWVTWLKKTTSLFFNISLFPQSTLYRKNVVLGERFRKAPCSLDQNAVSLWMAGQGVENKMCFHIYPDWCGCSQRICEKGAKKGHAVTENRLNRWIKILCSVLNGIKQFIKNQKSFSIRSEKCKGS